MNVQLWGVRGSLPTPYEPQVLENKMVEALGLYREALKSGDQDPKEFLQSLAPFQTGGFGGNTACIEVNTEKQKIIVDAGSGIRRLGEKCMMGPCGLGKGEVHILMTHFHWDHLVGIPFFIPLFVPGNKIHFYSVSEGLEECIKQMFTKPFFPVPFERLGAEVHFHSLVGREEKKIGDIDVIPYQLDHPDPCWGYQFKHDGRTLSYCVDTEGVRVAPQDLGPDLPMYQNVDLMIYDAQYTFMEAAEKIDWGHASAPIGLDIALREKVKKVVFVHHDPGASDEKIADAERQTREYYDSCKEAAEKHGQEFFDIEWLFGREGMVFQV